MVNTNTRFAERKNRTMMYNVEDLKSRALVESNILKQFILSANAKKRGEFKPKLDDILIHDYQMANSVTLNVILSNYMVDLAYAVDCIENPLYGTRDSYFKLVRGLDVNDPNLDDQTKLILDVSNGNGSFKTRELALRLKQIWDYKQKVTKFINLDSIWYCNKVVDGHDTIAIVKEMNNFYRDANPFGGNPFDKYLYNPPTQEGRDPTSLNVTFNNWLDGSGRKTLNCIVENRFYKNVMDDEQAIGSTTKFGKTITACRYLLCVPNGFYGLESYWKVVSGVRTFMGFVLHDIGRTLPVLGNPELFDYKFCSFHVIGNKDETTLFLAIKETSTAHPGKYHYFYLNESSLDETYGFTEIDSVVVDQLIAPPSEVFTKVEHVRELDTVNIAMTDYGFWDIEANTTNNVNYSYRNGKEYANDIGNLNQDVSKLTTPTIDYKCQAIDSGTGRRTQIAVEYSSPASEGYLSNGMDRIWKLTSDKLWYQCQGIKVDGQIKKYRSTISPNGVELPFFGGTEHFAVYKAEGDDPIHVLVNITEEQFINMLFANSQLTNYFIEWLYEQVVHGPNGSIHNGKGEYYLWNNNGNFIANLGNSLAPSSGISYSGLEFGLGKQYTAADGTTIQLDVSTKFQQIDDVVKAYDSTVSTMTQYCNNLNSIVTAAYGSGTGTKKIDINWLVDKGTYSTGGARILDTMKTLFSKVTWPEEKFNPFVKDTLDKLVAQYKLLKYFRDYLKLHLENDLADFQNALLSTATPTTAFASGEEQRVVAAVQDYIKGKVGTCLVLGGYSETDKEGRPLSGNDRYPGIDQYLYQNQRKLNKVQARDIMSITNTLKEVMFAVQSTKFISECDSFDEMKRQSASSDLFTMTQNEAFVALSKLVKSDGKTLNVNWNDVKTWMFGTSPDNCSDDKMLKAFVRTQIYRPLFFKHDNYVSFSSNESVYSCTTTKWFVDHNGVSHKIMFQSGTWPDDPKVNKTGSGLLDTATYTIPEDKISFFKITNKFEYYIHYKPVDIVDSKFVLNDVEFYVVRPTEGSLAVNSIYFNEFQNNTEGQNQVAKVTNNKFKLNGVEYVIEGNEISVDKATTSFSGDEKEWKCEIVDDRFCFDETWYILERENEEYAYVKYADNKDNKLIELDVTPDGHAEYKPWDITFQFTVTGASAWNRVQVVQKHQSDVIDRLETERCEFDSTVITFDEEGNKTYDWYLANEILRIQELYTSQSQALLNLGNGVLYTGGLRLTTNPTMGTECRVQIRNDIQNEDVVTICELVKKYGEVEQVQQMGTLFDRDLKLDEDRVFRGNMGADNLVSADSSGNKAFFVKDMGKGLNNVNTAWVNYSKWASSYRIESASVGTANMNEETKELQVKWGFSDYSDPNGTAVKLTPIYKVDDSGNTTTDIIKYLATIGDGSVQYTVWVNDGYVHFVVNGNRYRLNLSTLTLDRLVVSDIQVDTVDFSTQYDPTQLRDNLAQNVKTTMLNKMVQEVIDSTRTSSGSIVIGFERPIAQYLDLFTDSASLDNYIVAWELDIESEKCLKFSQVYKNNLEDIDESNMSNGKVYGHLVDNITQTFKNPDFPYNQMSNIFVVDSPSINVTRVLPVDEFRYDILMDVNIVQNKNWMREVFGNNPTDYDNRYVIANAIIQDMRCSVTFTPKYNSTNGKMTYDVTYAVDKGSASNKYTVTYNQIVYNRNKKTKHKTIAPAGSIELHFSGVSGLNLTRTFSDRPLVDASNKLLIT